MKRLLMIALLVPLVPFAAAAANLDCTTKASHTTKKADLTAVLKILPALQNPTISSLSDDKWVAVNTIIDENTVRHIIPKLKAAGACGIVEYPLNKIID